MAPLPKFQDYVQLIVGGAVVIAFVFALSATYRTEPSVPTTSLRKAGHSSKGLASSSSSNPNIIFILADDLGWNGIGYESWEDDEYKDRLALARLSPTLTTLASQGISFTNYYAQEVCSPSRASLLTGRYPLNIGLQYGVIEQYLPWGLNLSETTLAQVLKDNGYDTHAVGKWHLGHYTARYLPTARGFDTFVGYLDGDNYYFSKSNPTYNDYLDFTVANSSCYGTDANDTAYYLYSTEYYRDLALAKIDQYKDSDTPFFLYLAFQAVHNPYYDPLIVKNGYTYKERTGLHADNFTFANDVIENDIPGIKTQLYGLTLNVFDSAVADIVDALDQNDMMDNTIIIFASDNGGCIFNGGRNYPLRGSKATLYEGGTKVDAFIYSPVLLADQSGKQYSNLFHVSDWFPTIMDMTNSDFTPATGYSLDGVSHYDALLNLDNDDYSATPREYMLYNAYTKVVTADDSYTFDVWTNGIFAIRNSQYKLIHAYNGSILVSELSDDYVLDDDTDLSTLSDCKQFDAYEGTYQMQFFDLVNDPYETTNLYNTTDEALLAIRTALYSELFQLNNAAIDDYFVLRLGELTGDDLTTAEAVWGERGSTIGPFKDEDDDVPSNVASLSYPVYCGALDATELL